MDLGQTHRLPHSLSSEDLSQRALQEEDDDTFNISPLQHSDVDSKAPIDETSPSTFLFTPSDHARDLQRGNPQLLLQAISAEQQIKGFLDGPDYSGLDDVEKKVIIQKTLEKMVQAGIVDNEVLAYMQDHWEEHRGAALRAIGTLIRDISNKYTKQNSLDQLSDSLYRSLPAPAGFQLQPPRVGFDTRIMSQDVPSTIFGPMWEELECLGKGAFGSVWACKNLHDGEIYAIKKIIMTNKVLTMAQIVDEKAQQKAFEGFHHEVKVLARLDHPNIVRYYTAWMERMSSEQYEKEKHKICPDQGEGYYDYATDGGDISNMTAESQADFSANASLGLSGDHPINIYDHQDNAERSLLSNNSSKDLEGSEMPIVPFSNPLLAPESNARLVGMVPSYAQILSIQMARYDLSLDGYIRTPRNDGLKPRDFGLEYQFNPKVALDLFLKIVEGVEYMHHYHLVHRDLKPANIFLKVERGQIGNMPGSVRISGCLCHPEKEECSQEPGCMPGTLCFLTPKIGDFGLTADIKRNIENINTEPSAIQSHIGTLLYTAPPWTEPSKKPKSALAEASTLPPSEDIHHTDAYALGIIFLELLQEFSTGAERFICIGDLRSENRPNDPFPKNFCKHTPSLPEGSIAAIKEIIMNLTGNKLSRMSIMELKHRIRNLIAEIMI